jgi:hypothetical protein
LNWETKLIDVTDRYYGKSSPVDELTPKTMQHLTFKNALADTVHFAKNVKLPFDNSTKSTPDNAVNLPGILSEWA